MGKKKSKKYLGPPPGTAYSFFVKEKKSHYKKRNPKLKASDLTKLVKKKWDTLKKKTKQYYVDIAEKAKDEYNYNKKKHEFLESTLYKEFWCSEAKKFSENLWEPDTKNLKNFKSEKFGKALKKHGLKSWFEINKFKSCTPVNLLKNALLKNLDFENDSIKGDLKVKKIRLYPNLEERQKIENWLGASRWIYNYCVEKVNAKEVNVTEKDLIALIKTAMEKNEWLKGIPSEIRCTTIRDLVKAKNATFKTLRSFKFRSKKDNNQSLYIRRAYWTPTTSGFFSFLGKIKTSEEMPKLEHDLRLVKIV